MPRRRHRQDCSGSTSSTSSTPTSSATGSAGPTWSATRRPATSTPTAPRACCSASTRTARSLWQHSLTEEYGRISGYGGRVTSPIVDGDLVIIGMVNASWGEQATGGNRFVAFDKKTGAGRLVGQRPACRSRTPTTRVPVVAVINGERLLISGGGDGGVHAFKVRTGEKVWSYIFGTGGGQLLAGRRRQPGLHRPRRGERAATTRRAASSASTRAKVENGKPKLVWKVDGIKVKFASPILARRPALRLRRGRPRLYCLDAKDGKQLWKFTSTAGTARARRSGPTARSTSREVELPSSTSSSRATRTARSCTRQFFRSPDGGVGRGDQRQPGGGQRPGLLHDQHETCTASARRTTRREAGTIPAEPAGGAADRTASRPTCRSCPPTWC